MRSALLDLHSPDFYEALAAAGEDILRCGNRYLISSQRSEGRWHCVLAVIGYGIGVGALAAACGATLGIGCILALIGHEVEAAAVLVACTT
jgi:hypothetical protein